MVWDPGRDFPQPVPAPAPGCAARCLRPRPLSPAPGSALLSLAEKVVEAPGGGSLQTGALRSGFLGSPGTVKALQISHSKRARK